MVDLSLKEVQYFERLVEELLFLAQIKESSLQNQFPPVEISKILLETADDILLKYQHADKQIRVESLIEGESFLVHGDPHLFARLFRNALENAFSFAKSKVTLVLRQESGKIKIFISDDGPGFSAEALTSFGTRRTTRRLQTEEGGRVSLGLGSVVMRNIVEALNGHLSVANSLDSGSVSGGRLEIDLPVRST